MAEFLQKHLTLALFSFAANLTARGQQVFARLAAFIAWHSHSVVRKVTEVNLVLCYPMLADDQRKKLAKLSVYHTMLTALEIPAVWINPADESLARISAVDGKELVDEAQKAGKGVIVIAPHLGNWEILGYYLATHYSLISLYKPPQHEWMEEISRQGRMKIGSKLAPTNKKGVLAVLKALKAGEVTGILPDQIPDKGNGVAYVPFFGHNVATMTLIPNLLQRGNAIAVAAFAQRLQDGTFKIIFRSVPEDLYNADETIAATALNKTVEDLVNIAPEQYQWEYKRFRRGVDGKKQRIY